MYQPNVGKAIILIAGVGKRLKGITEAPKCMLKIRGVTLLERYFIALKKVNILNVVLVVGYKKDMIIEFIRSLNFCGNIKIIENADFTKGSILSLYKAKDELDGKVLLMDGDIYFETGILDSIMCVKKENLVAIDTTSTSSGEEMMAGIKDRRIIDIKRNLVGNYDTVGEAVGFFKFNNQACQVLKAILEESVKLGELLGYEDILPLLFQKVYFEPIIIDGLKWVEIDFREDICRARRL